jgi:hypothetical protein
MKMSLRFVRTKRRRSARGLSAAGLLCLLLLAGCGGSASKPTPTAAPQNTPTPSIPTATPAPAVLGKIVWATSIDPVTFAPVDKTASFLTNAPVIYAVIPVQAATPGLILTANWIYNDTTLTGVSSTATASQSIANGWVEFHLTLASGHTWPDGTYAVTVRQSNGSQVSAKVSVKKPA